MPRANHPALRYPRAVSDPISHDPVDLIWLATARRLGLTVRRRSDVFASTDGRGTLWLGSRDTLDPDDCTAQMVLHELCHWVVNGPDAVHPLDWGFEPMEGLDWREYPTLRVQRWWADRYALTDLLAPTTAARAYWDRLVDALTPLDDSPQEAAIVAAATAAVERSQGPPWSGPLGVALGATATIAEVVRPYSSMVTSTW